MEYSFQIKLINNDIPAKALMLIKRATGVTPEEIKRKTVEDEPFSHAI